MNNYEFLINEKNLLESIKKDNLKRNKKLNNLIKLANQITNHFIICLDGDWGSGKTVFIKQLQVLNSSNDLFEGSSEEQLYSLEQKEIDKFRKLYTTYYYNAWENDLHSDVLLSLIYNMINDFPKEKSQTADGKVHLPFDLKELLKTLSGNAIDLEKVKSFEDVAKEIFTIEEKRNSLNLLLDNIIPKGKRLLLIVDELDRCNPEFAMKTLEVIKHLYNNDRIVFLVASNNKQLVHTIARFYGDNFDGYGYLNKFYDFIINIGVIDKKMYLSNILKTSKEGNWIDEVTISICQYFDFSMRKINRFIMSLNTIKKYFVHQGYYNDYIVKYLYVPYLIALKINNIIKYDEFLNGQGFETLEDYITSNNKLEKIIEYSKKEKGIATEDVDNLAFLKAHYNLMFNEISDDYDSDIHKNSIFDVISLIGDFSSFGGEGE